jgi:hypothetical protein
MTINQEYTLTFTDNQWVCYDDTFRVLADSLEEIDEKIEKHLRSTFKKGEIEVAMFFDFDRFPAWHRQYMPHYFNRNWTINLNK